MSVAEGSARGGGVVWVFKGAEDFEVVHARDLCGNASRTRAGLDGRGGGGLYRS